MAQRVAAGSPESAQRDCWRCWGDAEPRVPRAPLRGPRCGPPEDPRAPEPALAQNQQKVIKAQRSQEHSRPGLGLESWAMGQTAGNKCRTLESELSKVGCWHRSQQGHCKSGRVTQNRLLDLGSPCSPQGRCHSIRSSALVARAEVTASPLPQTQHHQRGASFGASACRPRTVWVVVTHVVFPSIGSVMGWGPRARSLAFRHWYPQAPQAV